MCTVRIMIIPGSSRRKSQGCFLLKIFVSFDLRRMDQKTRASMNFARDLKVDSSDASGVLFLDFHVNFRRYFIESCFVISGISWKGSDQSFSWKIDVQVWCKAPVRDRPSSLIQGVGQLFFAESFSRKIIQSSKKYLALLIDGCQFDLFLCMRN